MTCQEEGASLGDIWLGFPSILLVRDLRRKLLAMKWPPRLKVLARILALDPMAFARALRIANSEVRRRGKPAATVNECLEILGPKACASMFKGPGLDVAGTSRIRKLWVHSLATAHGAAFLAEYSGEVKPDLAYAAALVHDLGLFMSCIAEAKEGETIPVCGSRFMKAWNFPGILLETIERIEKMDFDNPPPLTRVVLGAEHLADSSGFCHPEREEFQQELIEEIYGKVPKIGKKVRFAVETALRTIGIGIDEAENPPKWLLPKQEDKIPLGEEREATDLGKACNTVLEFARSENLHTPVTASIFALHEFLGMDRVWFFKWPGPGRGIRLKIGFDQSPGYPNNSEIMPCKKEMGLLGEAADKNEPFILDHEEVEDSALLNFIASDSAIIAPVKTTGISHGFILADKGLQGIPINDAAKEPTKAIAGITALITENLLVQRVALRHGHAANRDPLTGVFNRRAGLARLSRFIEENKHTGKVTSLIMLDVDDFKRVNDTWGHQVGDEILKIVSRVLVERFDDIGMVTRIGGEEFLVLVPGKGPEEIIPFVEEVRQEVERAGIELENGVKVKVTVSLGVTATMDGNDTVEKVMQRVDRALYASKKLGKNRFSVDLEEV